MLLKGFLTGYIESRTDVRDRTRNNLWQAANFPIEFLGSDRRLDSITPGDCDQFRVWMLERLGENTVRRHCGRGKPFFRAAVRRKLIAESLFVDMQDCGVRPSDPSRQFFLSEPDSLRVLEECPTLQWKRTKLKRHEIRHGLRRNGQEHGGAQNENPPKFPRIPKGPNLFLQTDTPDRIRTCDPSFRKAVLYPTELRGRAVVLTAGGFCQTG
jgi:hypothetical protein